jgi:hypothetical protein
MAHKEITRKQWKNYFLSGIICAILLLSFIRMKYVILFWSYFAIMGISALISEWYMYSDYEHKYLDVVQFIFFASTFGLFMWPIFNYFFY